MKDGVNFQQQQQKVKLIILIWQLIYRQILNKKQSILVNELLKKLSKIILQILYHIK